MAETLSVTDMLPNKFEPKRGYRWLLAIEGIDAFLVSKTKRPDFTLAMKKIDFMNSYRKVAGKLDMGNITCTLHDPIAPSGAQQVMEWIRTHYESVSGRAGYADFYKRDIQLKLLDPIGTVVELWDIKGAFIKQATFGALNYDDQDTIMMIDLTIEFDNCVLQF
jgi:hypothetical protein